MWQPATARTDSRMQIPLLDKVFIIQIIYLTGEYGTITQKVFFLSGILSVYAVSLDAHVVDWVVKPLFLMWMVSEEGGRSHHKVILFSLMLLFNLELFQLLVNCHAAISDSFLSNWNLRLLPVSIESKKNAFHVQQMKLLCWYHIIYQSHKHQKFRLLNKKNAAFFKKPEVNWGYGGCN